MASLSPSDVRAAAVGRYVDLVSGSSEATMAALRGALAPDVTFAGPMGAAAGSGDVVTAAANPTLASLLATGTWHQPETEDDHLVVRATAATGTAIGGVAAHLWFDEEGLIHRIAVELLPAPPPTPQVLALTDDIKGAVNGALENGTPTLIAYVDDLGAPHLSFRGSTHVHSDHQLAIWNRDPQGGMSRAIGTNPHVAVFYRDHNTQTTYTFSGRATLATEPATTELVYAETPERERNLDPMKRGAAVIIDLDRVEGGTFAHRVIMTAPRT
jgi:hypothetical protein